MGERLRGVRARAVAPVGSARLTGPFWWQARGPVDVGKRTHKTKIDALRAFAADPINARTLEEFAIYPDESARARMYARCSGEFDAVNERLGLRGPRKVCSIDDAMWNLAPRRGRQGFYVEDIDVDTLNEIADAAQAQGRFRMPEPIAEAVAHDEEAAYYADAEGDDRAASCSTAGKALSACRRSKVAPDTSFPFGGARAEGGRVEAGRSYIVGEDGPEVFVPDEGGQIVPAVSTGTKIAIGAGLGVVGYGLFRWWKRRRRRRRRRLRAPQ